MAGLYTGSNLSEQGLNAIDALGNLYEPGIHNDINLFSQSSSLTTSLTTSGVRDDLSQTKFLVQGTTFSNDTTVWVDSGTGLIKSISGSVVNLKLVAKGGGYSTTSSSTVQVRLYGTRSGARNCVAEVTVNVDGTISGDNITIVSGGSGYNMGEELSIVPACQSGKTPQKNKCFNYTGNKINKTGYKDNARFLNVVYPYVVKQSDGEGFYLYDKKENNLVDLGTTLPTTPFVFVRSDTITRENLSALYSINGSSQTYSYNNSYSISSTSLKASIDLLDNNISLINSELVNFIQNCRTPSSGGTDLEIGYNNIVGRNIYSPYRMVFRDPDGYLDDPAISYSTIQSNTTAPGIWVRSGLNYQRVFTSNRRPFISQSGDKYLSPVLNKISSGSVVSALETGDYKYSISAGYYKPGQPINTSSVIGFNTEIKTLIQNLSLSNNDGGFVYHRTLSPLTIRGNLKSWPLFSFKEQSVTKEARFLAI